MRKVKKYGGVIVPMISPFTEDLAIDEQATARIVDHIIKAGAHPFILGTTGESSSISKQEKIKLVEKTIEAAAGRANIYVGISGNCMYDSVEEAHQYYALGARIFVAHMPSYYPLESDQMLRYFEELANELPSPLVLYNIPVTTNLSLPLDIVDRLSRHPNIVGFKDSERGLERLESSVSLWKDRQDFSYLLGWAAMSHKALQLGADGIVPSSGNLVPCLYQAIFKAVTEGTQHEGEQAQQKADVISAMYQQDRILSKAFPIFKAMMSAYGLCQPFMAPPMYKLPDDETEAIVRNTLAKFGDLQQINNMY